MYQVYGIPNCNTVKKALNHLDSSGIQYEFINFKKSPPMSKQIDAWKKDFGDWPVNTKGPTFRKIKEKFELANATEKKALLKEFSSAIKRPILVKKQRAICFGYDEQVYSKLK
ncbi:MAG: Spx/MgsR family RNA polymerase-binding regulatory protein [Bacteriovoracaceae bacterium]|nr:Spx/MgsR family RNA polymerase-binding regulatory protein [Bacteriovoracaceae bacterium]